MSQHVEGHKLVITPDNRDKALCEQLRRMKADGIGMFGYAVTVENSQCKHPFARRIGTVGSRDTTCGDCGEVFINNNILWG